VFLKDDEGKLRLAAGRNSKGESLLDDKTISHSALEESLRSNSEFLLTDTGSSADLAGRQSIVAYDLRTVICIPLRKRQVQATREQTPAPGATPASEVTGVLYVDSRFASREFSGVGHDILRAIATEAASLIEKCAAGAGGRRVEALSAGVDDCGEHPAAADAGEDSGSAVCETAG